MSIYLGDGKVGKRRPSIQGVAVFDISQGSERIRKWPRKRTIKKGSDTADRNELFRQMQWAAKYFDPNYQAQIMEARKGMPLLPRDIQTMLLSNTLCMFVTPNGTKWFPEMARAQVSESLDTLGQTLGQTLVRGAQFWEAAPPPDAISVSQLLDLIGDTEGKVLQRGATGWEVVDAPNPQGVWWWAPPQNAGWTLVSGDATNLALTYNTFVGLEVGGGAPVAGDKCRAAFRTITSPTAPWSVEWQQTQFMPNTNFSLAGMAIRDPTGGRVVSFCVNQAGRISIDRQNSMAGFNSNAGFTDPAIQSTLQFFKLSSDGTSIFFYGSNDGVTYFQIYTASLTQWLANKPTQVGILIQYTRTTGLPNRMNIGRWVTSGVS